MVSTKIRKDCQKTWVKSSAKFWIEAVKQKKTMPSESPFRFSDGIFAPFVYKSLKSLYTHTCSK
ncbi:hypothetical protein NEIFLAOT_01130 [Neisseria flavescens NRL30031/H210]|uniref:Uncharacterized protein n=1 Tax=Neisseria flavescens NRL30031/H210 TaxID=546264 RepID=C0EMF9_NEIFL|nr:hypothetical protein NEIFLAOT_01130 [Neisseria flavescens NRL30031/H210]